MKDALKGLPGVTNVELDYPSKTFTCTVKDKASFDTAAAIKVIEESDAGDFKAKLK